MLNPRMDPSRPLWPEWWASHERAAWAVETAFEFVNDFLSKTPWDEDRFSEFAFLTE
jgi:hypothetical protein